MRNYKGQIGIIVGGVLLFDLILSVTGQKSLSYYAGINLFYIEFFLFFFIILKISALLWEKYVQLGIKGILTYLAILLLSIGVASAFVGYEAGKTKARVESIVVNFLTHKIKLHSEWDTSLSKYSSKLFEINKIRIIPYYSSTLMRRYDFLVMTEETPNFYVTLFDSYPNPRVWMHASQPE